jgi:prepilin signal peptidase PulO-like enzyme (type II secretory pathway)
MPTIVAVLIGLAAGYVIDYLADVIPTREKWGLPSCTTCGTHRSWQDFLLLSPCKSCNRQRAWRIIALLFAGIITSLLLWNYPTPMIGYWLSMLMVTYFGVVVIIDIEHRLILHTVSLAGAVFGLLTGTLSHGIKQTLVGGVTGFLFMGIFYLAGVQFARYRARKQGIEYTDEEALGFGDVTISGVLGLILGFSEVMQGLITGILLAGGFSIVLILSLLAMKKLNIGNLTIPYGPFLVAGACVYLFFR